MAVSVCLGKTPTCEWCRAETPCRLACAPSPHLHGSNRDVALLPPPISAPPVGYNEGRVRVRHGFGLCLGAPGRHRGQGGGGGVGNRESESESLENERAVWRGAAMVVLKLKPYKGNMDRAPRRGAGRAP
eukprot:scaffold3122_cov136-Isochrysis_galbana.AAC.4